jgi:hypothetical protein
VEEITLEIMQALNVWPFPVTNMVSMRNGALDRCILESASSIDEHITLVLKHALFVSDLKQPLARAFIPCCRYNFVIELHISLRVIFGRCALDILQNLRGCCVIVGPVRIWLKRVAVVVCRNVTLASGIPVKC